MGTILLNPPLRNKGYLMKIGDAAKRLHVSEQTIRDWTNQDKLTAYLSDSGQRHYYDVDIELLRLANKGISQAWLSAVIVRRSVDGIIIWTSEEGESTGFSLKQAPFKKISQEHRYNCDLYQLLVKHNPQVNWGHMDVEVMDDNSLISRCTTVAISNEEAIATIKEIITLEGEYLNRYSYDHNKNEWDFTGWDSLKIKKDEWNQKNGYPVLQN